MANRFISLVVLLVFLAPTALAQQIYKWKDGKGRWHFSNAPPSGTTVEKVMEGRSVPKAVPARFLNQNPLCHLRQLAKAKQKISLKPPPDNHRVFPVTNHLASGCCLFHL